MALDRPFLQFSYFKGDCFVVARIGFEKRRKDSDAGMGLPLRKLLPEQWFEQVACKSENAK
ncbi:hypothetical protein GCM10011586_10900 [Silvibacterium dinghuense]|nr:hypothetical protein GCM10011586_10900 [Silvibacterium dinghuense]